jgi:hypothetical protein
MLKWLEALMKIVRYCGRSINDLYLILSKDDWELGDPEGLAHWDGSKWKWILRIDRAFSQQISCFNNEIIVMDIDANTWRISNDVIASHRSGPVVAGNVAPPQGVPPPSFYRFAFAGPGNVLAIGDAGFVCMCHSSGWTRIETGTKEKLNDILQNSSALTICGNHGVILQYDGARCKRVQFDTTDDLLRIDSGSDGSTYILSFSSQTFSFLELKGTTVVADFKLPHDVIAMSVIEKNKILYSTYDGVYIWDGMTPTPLMPGLFVGQIESIGNHITLASIDLET